MRAPTGQREFYEPSWPARTDGRFLLADGRGLSSPRNPPLHIHRQNEASTSLTAKSYLSQATRKSLPRLVTCVYPCRLRSHFSPRSRPHTASKLLLSGRLEKVVTESGVAATSGTLPPADLQQPGTPEQMRALFQSVGMSAVALPDSLRELRSSSSPFP